MNSVCLVTNLFILTISSGTISDFNPSSRMIMGKLEENLLPEKKMNANPWPVDLNDNKIYKILHYERA